MVFALLGRLIFRSFKHGELALSLGAYFQRQLGSASIGRVHFTEWAIRERSAQAIIPGNPHDHSWKAKIRHGKIKNRSQGRRGFTDPLGMVAHSTASACSSLQDSRDATTRSPQRLENPIRI